MASNHTANSESEIMLNLLRAVHRNKALTQRSAASDLGVALGLVNAYLKRCVRKGFVKVSQVPRNRYAYYLTPKGFAEKSRLTAEFMSQSLSLFRQAQTGYSGLLADCAANDQRDIALYGASDLTQIVRLYAREYPVTLIGVVAGEDELEGCAGLPRLDLETALPLANCFVITDLRDPQHAYDTLARAVDPACIRFPALLEIAPNPRSSEGAE